MSAGLSGVRARPLGTVALAALAVLALSLLGSPAAGQPAVHAESDERSFPETGVRIEDDHIWDYFQRRGGLRTFGYPVSNTFLLLGTRVQIFQRHVLQIRPDRSVAVLNLFADDLFPYTQVNGSTLPPADPVYLAAAPAPTDLGAALAFVALRAPDVWQGEPVRFRETFQATVRFEDAFPDGEGDQGLLPGFALELWGLPISAPMRDTSNHAFVYQRFQKGIMHYDAASGQTQGLLLADYFKAILAGDPLPPDLQAQAGRSRFYAQFDPQSALSLARPALLPATDLLGAFPGPSSAGSGTGLPPAGPAAAAPLPTIAPGMSTCQGDELMTFAPGAPVVGNEVLIAVTSVKPHQYVRLTGPSNPVFLRERDGQRGLVWEWTTTVAFPGRHDFTFYVDSTAVCTANYVTVGPAPGTPTLAPSPTPTPIPTATPTSTSTPLPTAVPTATPFPTSTPIPTSTPVPTATPQVASATKSTASASRTSQLGNNSASVTLTVTLLDGLGNGVPGKLVRLTSSRPELDNVSPGPDQFTNSQGQATYILVSCAAATAESEYTLDVLSDALTLVDKPKVTWTQAAASC